MSSRRSGKSPASVHAALALLTAAYVLSYVDRTIIALMVGPIRADLGMGVGSSTEKDSFRLHITMGPDL